MSKVYAVGNKTTLAFFESKADAESFSSRCPATAGVEVTEIQVIPSSVTTECHEGSKIDSLRQDLKAAIMRCCLNPYSAGLDHQVEAIMDMLDAKYFSLEQMEQESEGLLGQE